MLEITLAFLFLAILFYIIYWVFTNKNIFTSIKEDIEDSQGKPRYTVNQRKESGLKKQSKHVFKEDKTSLKNNIHNHPWLCTILKGHTDTLLDFTVSSNGMTLITCSKDHFVLIWNTEEFVKGHVPLRLSLSPDYADIVKFSPDNKAFILHLNTANILRVYAISKRESPKSYKHFDLPKVHNAKMIGFEVASTGIFIMSYYTDSVIVFTNFKGHELKTINTNQISLEECILSPCARFIATRGLTSDAKLWKTSTVSMDEMGAVDCFATLTLPTSVRGFSFSSDSSRIATIGQDCSWKIWEFLDVATGKVREAPKLYSQHGGTALPLVPKQKLTKSDKALKKLAINGEANHSDLASYESLLCSLSDDASCLALLSYLAPRGWMDAASGGNRGVGFVTGFRLCVYGTTEGGLIDEMRDEDHTGDHRSLIDDPTKMAYALQDTYILISGDDRWLYVLHNVPGYKARLEQTEARLEHESNASAIARLKEQKVSLENIIRDILAHQKS